MSARMKNVAATAASVAAAAAVAVPGTASAIELVEVKPPAVTATSAATTIHMSITNPHKLLDAVGCNAMVVNAADVPGVVTNPLKLLEPGVVVFPNFTNFDSLFGVMPGQSKTYAVQDVKPGLYGVIGACASLWNVGEIPTITNPQVLAVMDMSLGSVGSSEIPAFGS